MHKIVLVGSVTSSFTTLKKLVQHKMNIAAVFGFEPKNMEPISGFVNMHEYCVANEIPYYPFVKISSDSIKQLLQSIKPDIFFVVGLSQLIPMDMLNIAKLGNIGFHPTLLPRGRGRAPIAWLILEEKYGAANFFLMNKGVDEGPLFVQQKFIIEETDDAKTVEQKILSAIEKGLDEWLPKLKRGEWNPVQQEEMHATYFGKRTEEDGLINWGNDALFIDKLIRASAIPHPGAYTFLSEKKIIIYHSGLENQIKIKGVVGRVLIEKNDSYLVQTGNGILWISEIFDEMKEPLKIKVGQKLGYYPELEIYKMNKEIQKIKEKIGL